MKNGPAMTGQRKIWKDKSKFYNAGGRQLPPAGVFLEKFSGAKEILEGNASCSKLYWSKTVMELPLNRRIPLTVS